ncbi:MAG: hypothetical protein LCH85_22855 [Chloroflexi bacterium]|nr:hypothetical protein [Chloroflexota bacterium]
MARKRIVGNRIGFYLILIGILLNLGTVKAQQPQSQPNQPLSSATDRAFEPTTIQSSPLTTSSVITGTWNPTIQNSLQSPGTISKLYVDANDRLYVTGSFNYLNGHEFNGLAAWDGNTWQGYGLHPNDPGSILAMTTYNDQLIVGGSFDKLAGQTMNGIARWNGQAFEAFGTGFRGTSDFFDYSNRPKIYDLDVVTDTLYISGNFSQFNNLAVNSLLAWRPSGYYEVADIDSSLYQFAAIDNAILLSGELLSINDIGVDYFALRQNGVWSNPPIPEGVRFYQELHTFDNTFYLRKYINQQPYLTQFYHWDANDWVVDSSVITGSARDLIQLNGQLYSATNDKLWQRTAAGWRSLDLPMAIQTITAIEASSAGIYLAGSFTVNGQASHLIFWDGNTITNLATTIQQGYAQDIANLNGQPLIIARAQSMLQVWNNSIWQQLRRLPYGTQLLTTADNTYLVGSSPFTTTSNLASAIWQVQLDGSLSAPVPLNAYNVTWTISGTDVLASMHSGTINNQPIAGTIAINGNQWRSFIPSYAHGNVYVTDQQIYSIRTEAERASWIIEMSVWDGTAWQYLTAWQQFDQRLTMQIAVWNGELYFLYRNDLRRFDFNSTDLVSVASFDDMPLVLRSTADYLYVAGRFNQVNNQAVGPLARWNGTSWQGLADVPNGAISQLAVTSDLIQIAGSFTHVGATTSLGVASFVINGVAANPSFRQFIPQAMK